LWKEKPWSKPNAQSPAWQGAADDGQGVTVVFTWFEKWAHNEIMYSKLSRLITLFAILVCLPLQGLAAVTMPSCQAHGQQMEMHIDADQSGDMSYCDHHDSDQPSKNAPCDKCFSCYLSAAQAIIPFNISIELDGVTPKVTGPVAEIPDSFTSSLFRPPRSTFA
jgi:hypothetical protein